LIPKTNLSGNETHVGIPKTDSILGGSTDDTIPSH
jgi:hypothetical protein